VKVEPAIAAAAAPSVDAPASLPAKPKAKPVPVPGSEPPQSFLVRHRQPILLAASVVALSFLTLNLINQRQADDTATAAPDTGAIEEADPAGDLSMAQAPADGPVAVAPEIAASDVTEPRAIPMVDSLQTGSIDAAAAQSFSPGNAIPKMPAAFKAIETNVTAVSQPPVLDGPVKVELPPETVGPLDLRQAAADGDARAQFEVAAIYTEGRAVPQDLAEAAIWYERSAAQGFPPAQYRLASLYENGKGVTKDLDQARLWYQRAAEAGNRMSMHNLAALYAGGELGKQDFAAAAGWFEKAASQGMTDSQFNLGMLYARGLGVPQNMEASYKWFALAALSGDKDAAKARDDIARSLDADTVTRLNGELDAWTPSAINLAANFAPIGTWTKDFDPGQVIDNRDVIVGVQTLLTRLGYDVGVPDGVAGPKTAEAIKAFERATGMSEVGAINPRLLAVLGSQPG
jgi:localization factor PodJL